MLKFKKLLVDLLAPLLVIGSDNIKYLGILDLIVP